MAKKFAVQRNYSKPFNMWKIWEGVCELAKYSIWSTPSTPLHSTPLHPIPPSPYPLHPIPFTLPPSPHPPTHLTLSPFTLPPSPYPPSPYPLHPYPPSPYPPLPYPLHPKLSPLRPPTLTSKHSEVPWLIIKKIHNNFASCKFVIARTFFYGLPCSWDSIYPMVQVIWHCIFKWCLKLASV